MSDIQNLIQFMMQTASGKLILGVGLGLLIGAAAAFAFGRHQ
jgi:hypothetical protein